MAAIKSSRPFSQFMCLACRHKSIQPTRRAFTTTAVQKLDSLSSMVENMGAQPTRRAVRSRNTEPPPNLTSAFSNILDGPGKEEDVNSIFGENFGRNLDAAAGYEEKAHRLHVYATKHNTHLTLVQPPRPASEMASVRAGGASQSATQQKKIVDMVMSLSTGNIGFRKAGRGSYDAAYQLAAFFLKQLAERGIIREIRKIEIVLRGFGAGREAVTKAILGTEGRHIRNRISAVVDATRLKQGGTRSPKPRRLG